MTLQITGAISLADIQTEFGGSNPAGLNEYYDGGAYVPPYTYGTLGLRVPTSGEIKFWHFYGTTKNVAITVSNRTITSTTYSPSTAYSAFKVSNNGYIFERNSGIYGAITETSVEQWCSPIYAVPGFEIKVSGSTNTFGPGSDAEDTWLTLDVNRTWSVIDDMMMSPILSFDVEIRRRSTTTPVYSAYITLEANQF
jgi:hypothetical protein